MINIEKHLIDESKRDDPNDFDDSLVIRSFVNQMTRIWIIITKLSLELDDQSDELKRNDVSEMQIMRLDVIHMRMLRIMLTLYCYSNLEIGTPPIYP